MKLKYKLLIKKLVILAILVVIIVILSLLKKNLFISEYVFSRGISRAYIFIIGNITSLFPFSIFEFLLVLFAITLLILVFRWSSQIKRNRLALFFKSALNVLIFALCLVLVYTSTASFSYYRKPLPLPQYNGENLDKDKIEEIIRYYMTKFQQVSDEVERDSNGKVVLPYTNNELNAIMVAEYARIGTLNGHISSFTPIVKKIVSSNIMSYQHITGISIAPTGEANINRFTPTNSKLLTMAHELAHTKGVMNENEANLMSYYLAITSDDIYLQYAGYMYTVGRLLEMAFYTFDEESYRDLYFLYPEKAKAERLLEYEFWDDYESVVDKISEYMNDLYLKFSGIDEGTASYIDTSDKIIITNPTTGEETVQIINYSAVQKMYIALYLGKD